MRFQISHFKFRRVRQVLILLALLWAGGWLLFRTGAGRDLVVRSIQSTAHGRLQIEGPTGDWPQRGQVARIMVSDADGSWLILSNLTWHVELRDLLRPPWRIKTLAAEAVDVLRPPVRSVSAKPARVPRLQLPEVRVKHLRYALPNHASVALDVEARVALEHAARGWWAQGDVRDPATGAHLDLAAQSGETTKLSVRLRETRGGPLARYWPRSQGQMTTTVWAERGAAGWQGSLHALTTNSEASVAWHCLPDGTWQADVRATNLAWRVLGRLLQVESGRLAWQPQERRGHYAVAARWEDEPLWAEGVLLRRADELSLPHMLITADGVRARVYVSRRDEWTAEARYSFQPGGAVQRWLPEAWDAEGRGTFSWDDGAFSLRAVLPRLQSPAGEVEQLRVDIQRAAAGKLMFDVGAVAWRREHGEGLREVQLKGHAERTNRSWTVEINGAQARHGAFPVSLFAPFLLTHDEQGWTWSTARWAVAEGELTTHGRAGAELAAEVTWKAVPVASLLADAVPGLSGDWEGHLALHGTPAQPELKLTTHLEKVYLRPEVAGVELSPADVRLSLGAAGGRAELEVTWAGWSDEPLHAEGEGPLRWSLRPWSLSVPSNEAGRASFRGRFDLAQLERVFDLRGTRLRGRVDGALDLSGSLQQPVVQGRVSLQDGRVDAPATGTSLRDIRLVVEGDRERLRVLEGAARDGDGGRLTLEGDVQFDPVRHFPVDATLRLARAEIWQRGGSRAVVDGALQLTGELRNWQVRGELNVPEAQVKLGRRRTAIPRLPVQGLTEESTDPVTPPRTAVWGKQVALSIKVRVPGGAEISGRGLEADWRADVHVGGTLAAPAVSGNVQARRGYFLFMGRRFDLENAWVGLDGRVPPAPVMNVMATSRAGDLVARLQASGPVREPVLELTSDPAYPQDEILSRLLFGKSADSISAFQAVRLAHGLNVLRGKGSTLDVLDRGQSLLRVDQLDLRQDSEQGSVSSVAVGKYIGRRVFVQGETALDGSGDVIAVEVDLAPSLTLQTEASPGIREGIGLKWRRDY
jgi:autotransporter translocation and assembly factor TamB